jgi:hypothetical protein
LNISPEFRFKLQATQLLAIGKKGIRMVLKKVLFHVHPIKNICHFICVLNFFIQTTLNHGALYCVLGDTLAAQLLGGFKEGVGMADKPCRTCEITHAQLSDSLHGSQFALREYMFGI